MNGRNKYVATRDITQGLLVIKKNERVWGEPVGNEGQRFIKVQNELIPAQWFSKL